VASLFDGGTFRARRIAANSRAEMPPTTERATPAQRRAIAEALGAIDAAIERGEVAVGEDFALLAAITDATGNPRFRRFLDFLGRLFIPRASVRIRALNLRAYLMTFQEEHRVIVAAIDARSVTRARDAIAENYAWLSFPRN
jgi:GntR family transcriptional repressor for pyruvate dehydrogenase complex